MAKVRKTPRKRTAKVGKEITPKIADALADEGERGYDLTEARRRRGGRPPLGGRGAATRLSSRATPEPTEQHSVGRGGRTLSDLAREAVARYAKS